MSKDNKILLSVIGATGVIVFIWWLLHQKGGQTIVNNSGGFQMPAMGAMPAAQTYSITPASSNFSLPELPSPCKCNGSPWQQPEARLTFMGTPIQTTTPVVQNTPPYTTETLAMSKPFGGGAASKPPTPMCWTSWGATFPCPDKGMGAW